MPSRGRPRVATALGVLAVAVALTTAGGVVRHPEGQVQVTFVLATVGFGAALALVGLLLVALRPGNRLGPVLTATGGIILAETALREYAFTTVPGAASSTAFWMSTWLDALWFPAGLTLALLRFPHGTLLSRRWRAVEIPAVVLAVVAALGAAVKPGPLSVDSYELEVARTGSTSAAAGQVGELAVVAGIALLLAAAASLIVRWRAAGRSGRQPLKPLALVAVVLLVSLPLQSVPPLHDLMVGCFVVAVVVGLPGALAVGALRYRLWELDPVLISLIVYGGLVVLAAAAYGAAVVVVGGLVTGGADDTEAALLPSVLATAVVAVLFGQVRAWLTAIARRAVLGVRATPYEALATLPRRLADGADADTALAEAARALRLGLGVPAARVRARPTELAAWSGESHAHEGELIVVTARHLGEEVGDVAVLPSSDRQLSRADRRLLDDLAAQAAPALRALALTAELRGQVEEIEAQAGELRASRLRLATAQFDERRRLERDLHDGAQQQLVTATVQLRRLQPLLSEEPEATEALDRCATTLGRCLDDLRELARGVLPPVLEARGLVAALRSRARTASVAVRVEANEIGRFDPVVESAVYFACLEALQNVAKHAPGATATIRLDAVGDRLTFDVADNGGGFAVLDHEGSGLLGMRDRIAAVGGVLTVHSTPGVGVTVRGVVSAPGAAGP